MIAVNLIRSEPHYRKDAFNAGLEGLGYRIEQDGKPNSRDDLLVIWNRMFPHEQKAAEWEAQGGTVLVCENGYLAPTKWSTYAISVHGHCGSGWFPIGDEDRFTRLGIALDPWRPDGGDILVCGQRGIGSRDMASPRHWERKTVDRLRAMGYRVRLREHPGRVPTSVTLEQDLAGASLCVIWSSASGVRALTLGIPVVYCAPHWICQSAATSGLGTVARPLRDISARTRAMAAMAHGQWTIDEIAAGEPFRRILRQIGEARW